MFNYWAELPLEILHVIFLCLYSTEDPTAKTSLAECALSCRNWRLAAQKNFFSEIRLNKADYIDKLCCIALKNNKLGE